MSTPARSSFAVAARLARREVRRHPWRHLLVTVLIFLPVVSALASFSAVATWQDHVARKTAFTSPADGGLAYCCELEPEVGSKQTIDHLELGLPPGIRTETWRTGADWLVTDTVRPAGHGRKLLGADVTEASDRSASRSQFVVHAGRLPRRSSEIFLTEPLARAGGWSIGDRVMSARADRTFRVVGTGVVGQDTPSAAAAITGLPASYWSTPVPGIPFVRRADGVRVSSSARQSLATWPATATERQQVREEPAFGEATYEVDGRIGPGLTLAAAAICAVVAVVASAAFAIASRRQLRSVGLLSTVGTDPGTIRIAMVLQGAIPGLVAGAAAVVTSAVVIGIVNHQGIVERHGKVYGDRLILSPGGAAIAVLLAVAAGVAAAWQPARTLSRIPTLSALAGRRPIGPVRTGVPMTGLVMWAVGAVCLMLGFGRDQSHLIEQLQPFLLILGVAAIALGAVGIAPLLVALLEPLAERRRGTVKMGLRGLTRHRTQSAATVAALGVALAIPVGLLTSRNTLEAAVLTGTTRQATVVGNLDQDGHPATSVLDDNSVEVAIRGALRTPKATQRTTATVAALGRGTTVIRTVPIPTPSGRYVLVATIDEAAARTALAPWAAKAIAAGHAVALRSDDDQVTVTSGGDTASFTVERSPGERRGFLASTHAAFLVGADALHGVGATRPSDSLSVVRRAPLTRTERRSIRSIGGHAPRPPAGEPTLERIQHALATGQRQASATPTAGVSVELYEQRASEVHVPPPQARLPRWNKALAVATAISLALALLVLTITLSLRAVDGEADQRAALAAGVAPAWLRNQRAFEGVVLALLGATLAVPLGWLPVQAARLGVDTSTVHTVDGHLVWLTFSTPGWVVIPVLLAPAVLAAVLWTVVPAAAAAVRQARRAGPGDLVAPRW